MLPNELYNRYLNSRKICTDTRNLIPGAIFFALKGGNFDGNQYVDAAIEGGCIAAVCDDPIHRGKENVYVVDDSLHCLQELAAHHRAGFAFPVLGITGSNGKTTSKELIRDVLAQKYAVYATRGNLNNHIGVPLTLLEIGPEVNFAIIEMGANHQGEIREYCTIADPDFGMITNIGKAHLEGFGGPEGVKKGKKELFDHLRTRSGKVFVSANQSILLEISEGMDRLIFDGEKSPIQLEIAREAPTLHIRWWENGVPMPTIQSHLTGAYNLDNIGAAVTIGRYFGVEPDRIAKAISAYIPSNQRSQLHHTASNTVILDAYNANPSSMEAALRNLKALNDPGAFFIMGDMKELGDASESEHLAMLNLATELGLSGAVIGSDFSRVAGSHPVKSFESTAEALAHFKSHPLQKRLILLKGSRSMKLEALLEVL